jgi:hypothetical protein
MFKAGRSILRSISRRLDLTGGTNRPHRSPRDIYSLEEYKDTFRELFLPAEDGDPLYRRKRTSEKAEQFGN